MTFDLVIVVLHDVEHTVQEGDRRLDFIDDLEDLTPDVCNIYCFTESDNLELVRWLVFIYTG